MTRDAITQQARQILLTYDPVPRDWQKEALRIWSINYRGTVSVVTGGGKTIFCLLSMKEALRQLTAFIFFQKLNIGSTVN